MTELEQRWRQVLGHMAEAARQAGRDPSSVRLVAVSKFHPASAVAALAALGQKDFGENYVQEARAKQAEVPGLAWHAVGPVQSGNAKEIAGNFAMLHTLASSRLALALARRLEGSGRESLDCLIQVNIG